MDVNFNWSTGEFNLEQVPYSGLFKDIKKAQDYLNSEADQRKLAFKASLQLRRELAEAELRPYLEYNAQNRGDLQASDIIDFKYQENIVSQCGKSVVWLQGQDTENFFIKKIDCRKSWCPVCGGKGGKIHNSRLHAILKRVNPEKYNLRQFVFTVPEQLREILKTRENLEKLVQLAKKTIEKFFGDPVFDAAGHVKKYKLKNGVIEYLHLFGDEAPGVFKPHVNIHIFEDKKVRLKLDASVLDSIKKYWLKKLKIFDETLSIADVHYCFRDSVRKNVHSLKYMARPWSSTDYSEIQDENLKRLLVLDLSGFLYVRFWGNMSNRKYKDEMDLSEIQNEVALRAGEKVNFLGVAPFDFDSWSKSGRLEDWGDGLYRVKRKKDS